MSVSCRRAVVSEEASGFLETRSDIVEMWLMVANWDHCWLWDKCAGVEDWEGFGMWSDEVAPGPLALPAEIAVAVEEDASRGVKLTESCSSAHLMVRSRGGKGECHVSNEESPWSCMQPSSHCFGQSPLFVLAAFLRAASLLCTLVLRWKGADGSFGEGNLLDSCSVHKEREKERVEGRRNNGENEGTKEKHKGGAPSFVLVVGFNSPFLPSSPSLSLSLLQPALVCFVPERVENLSSLTTI